MRETECERYERALTSSIGPARKLVADLIATSKDLQTDCAEMLSYHFRQALGGPLDPNGLLGSLPYAIAEAAAKQVKNPYVWPDFGETPLMRGLAAFDLAVGRFTHGEELNDAWVATSIVNLWQHCAHKLAGERVYELSVGLGERLLKTELHGLSTDDLKLPYPSIYIVIPTEMGLKLNNEISGVHDLAGVYVTEYEYGPYRHWKLLFWGPPNGGSEHEWDDTLFHFSVEMSPSTGLEETLDTCEAFRNSDDRGTPASRKYYREHWRQLFGLVMNTVIYCTWPDAELREARNADFLRLHEQLRKHPKGSHKYERTREKLRQTPEQRRVVLGPSVGRFESAPSAGGASPLVRTLVSGHWQRFAYGPGRSQRKWGWREPFWRGPEEGPESNPRRVLESTDG